MGKNFFAGGLTGGARASSLGQGWDGSRDGSLGVRQAQIPRAGLLSPDDGGPARSGTSDQRLDISVQPEGHVKPRKTWQAWQAEG
jgi:hypothetical protein